MLHLVLGIGSLSFQLAEGSIPKPESDGAGNKAHKISTEDRSQFKDGAPLLCHYDPSDRPVDG